MMDDHETDVEILVNSVPLVVNRIYLPHMIRVNIQDNTISTVNGMEPDSQMV